MRGNTVLVAVVALLVGVLVGSFASRSSLRAVEQELAQVKARLEKAESNAQAPGMALAMGLRSMMQPRAPQSGGPAEAIESSTATPVAGSPAAEVLPAGSPPPGLQLVRSEPNTEDRKKAVDAITAAWRLRAAQSRAAFFEAAEVSPEQQQALEPVLAQMNAAVKTVVDEALAKGAFKGEPQPRDFVELGVQLGEVYLDTDEDVRGVLTSEQLSKGVESGFDIFTQISPETMSPLLMQLENRDQVSTSEEAP
ncbi:MAG: hypothetical protein ACKO6N_11015 [Myxococcota bacterium]